MPGHACDVSDFECHADNLPIHHSWATGLHVSLPQDPMYEAFSAWQDYPGRQTSRDRHANTAYEDPYNCFRSPWEQYSHREHLPQFQDSTYGYRTMPHRYQPEADPGYIDLRFLPAFAALAQRPHRNQRAGVIKLPIDSWCCFDNA